MPFLSTPAVAAASTEYIRFVSRGARASDNNSGLSWAAPLATYEAAVASLGVHKGTIVLGPGTHTVTGSVTPVGGTRTVGLGPGTSTLSKTTSGAMFSSPGGGYVTGTSFESVGFSVTTGPVFSGSWSANQWESCWFTQTATDQAIFDVYAFTLNAFDAGCSFQHTAAATVPAFRGIGTGSNLNANRFRGTWTYSGNYAIWIEMQGGGLADTNDIDCCFEVCSGGCVNLLGGGGTSIKASIYDLGTATKDLFYVGKSTASSSTASRSTTFQNINRLGGTLGSGISDIKIEPATLSTTIIGVDRPSTGFTIDMGSTGGILIRCDAATVTNDSACLTIGHYTLKTTSSTRANMGGASSFPVGATFYDVGLHKPLWSDGTNWKDATGTTV